MPIRHVGATLLAPLGTAEVVIDDSQLTDPTVYKSEIHFQFNYHLYHVGVLTDGGTDTKADVLDDPWQLQQPITADY